MKKRSIITIVCLLLCFTNILSISAQGVTYINGEEATPEEVDAYKTQGTLPYINLNQVEPRWILVANIAQGLSFSGNQANCSAILIGEDNVVKIKTIISLKKQLPDGTYYKVVTWEDTNQDYFSSIEHYYPVYSSGRYLVEVDYFVYDTNGNCELLFDNLSFPCDFVYK